jgi:hypothetical protein
VADDAQEAAAVGGTGAPFEFGRCRVAARVTHVLRERDEDLHVVLRDVAGRTMIAEAPSANCNAGATAYPRTRTREARAALRRCARAELIGVAHFDFFHNQNGAR